MSTEIDYTKFTEVCKRAAKSEFKSFIVHNRMVMGFYDLSQDSDIGMHYILHIPDDYDNVFDQSFLWDNEIFIKRLNELRNKIKDERAKLKLPPRAVTGAMKWREDGETLIVETSLQIHELVPPPVESKRKTPILGDVVMDLGFDMECKTFNDKNMPPEVENMLRSLTTVIDRIEDKIITVDILQNDLVKTVQDFPRIFYCKLDAFGETIQMPLMKSFFRGINTFDKLYFNVYPTNIKGVYIYLISLSAKGLTDRYISYIQNFK